MNPATRLPLTGILVVALLACAEENDRISTITDQCKREQLFSDCLKNLPHGPDVTKYNDWDEVVQQCGSIAHSISRREPQFIAPECRGER